MSVALDWGRTSRPSDGLRGAMERIARDFAIEGEYTTVDILSTPKTSTGGKRRAPHFKVRLHGTIDGQPVRHLRLIDIHHTGGRRYIMTGQTRDKDYPYSTLVAKNRPHDTPKIHRLRREAEATAEEAMKAQSEGQK